MPRSPIASRSSSSIGVHDVIVSGFPNLEETRWMSDGLVPELARRGLLEGGECR